MIRQENLHPRHDVVRICQMGVEPFYFLKGNPVLPGDFPEGIPFLHNVHVHCFSPFHRYSV